MMTAAVTCTGPYVQLYSKRYIPLDEDVVENGGVNIAVTICFSAF